MKFPQFYKLTPPSGEGSFFAVLLEYDNGIAVTSTRSGKWEDSPDLLANIFFPEQDYNDWDIEVVKAKQVPTGWEMKEE